MIARTSPAGRMMRGTLILLAATIAGTFLPAIGRAAIDTTKHTPTEHPILAPCSRYESRYDDLEFSGKYLQEWPAIYHKKVDEVIEDHLKMPELKCDAKDYQTFLKPGDKLKALAQKLPTWRDDKVQLTRYDLGRVLLEYLRVYECALNEFATMSYIETAQEISKMEDAGIRAPDPDPDIAKNFLNIILPVFNQETIQRLDMIDTQKKIARESLTRTLAVVSAMDRLRPVEMELQCTQQISLDIRNATALAAEAGACLPKGWNAKDILRDLQ